MATPMIVGVSGLLKSQNATWTRSQIIPQILNTADNINSLNPSYAGLLGSGRVNAFNALGGAPTPTITVISPNGGETWTVGQTYAITWSSQNLSGNVNIKLNRSYPGGTWESLFAATGNDGSEPWTVAGATGSACRIRVESAGNPSIFDESNANFTITSGGGQPVTLFSEGFEGSFSGSLYSRGDSNSNNGSDYWDYKTLRPHSGSKSNYCAGIGSPTHPPYDNYMKAYFSLNSAAAVNVAGYNNVTCNFWVWYNVESGYDYLRAQYYSGSTWVDFPNSSWSGSSGGWVQKTYILTGFTTFRFRFYFTSDYSITAEGAYVDDILITGTPTAAPGAEGGIEVVDLTPNVLSLIPPAESKTDADGGAESGLPAQYSLQQNAPNPFNPSTSLTFSLPEAGFVNLAIYSLNGEKVATLTSGWHDAGVHTLIFDGSNLAGGVYFARLDAGSFMAIRKMILLK